MGDYISTNVKDLANYENHEAVENAYVHLDQIFMQNSNTIVQEAKMV